MPAEPRHENRRALETYDFPVLDSRTSGLHVCSRDVSIYCIGEKMAAIEAGFEENFSGSKWYQFGECLCQKVLMKNTVVLKKDGNFLPGLASH